MKLSEAKRRAKVGVEIQVIGHYNPKASGTRTVTKVQGNGFWFSHAELKRGWCPWPSASLTRSDGPDTITLMMDSDRPMSTLTFPGE